MGSVAALEMSQTGCAVIDEEFGRPLSAMNIATCTKNSEIHEDDDAGAPLSRHDCVIGYSRERRYGSTQSCMQVPPRRSDSPGVPEMSSVPSDRSMRRCGFLVVAFLSSSAASLFGAEMTTFGPAVELLQPSDAAAIARLARGRALLAIEVQRSDTWEEGWLAFAYLRPESDVNGLRRGRIVDVRTLVTDTRAQGWRVTARNGRYAQVALPGSSFRQSISHTALDRPFRVFGKFSDAELAGLVAYIRSSPQMPVIKDPDGTSHRPPDQLDGHRPIVLLSRVDRSSVEILLAYDEGSGQRATLRYRAGAWHVDEINLYIV